MNRKEFLLQIWRRCLKPLCYLLGVLYCLVFLHKAYYEEGTERTLLLLCFVLILLGACGTVASFFTFKSSHWIKGKLSANQKGYVRIFALIADYLLTLAYGGALTYYMLNKEWNPVIFLSVMAVSHIYSLVKRPEKIARLDIKQYPVN